MKVLLYISNYKPIGGIETFVKNFYKRMSSLLDLIVLYDQGECEFGQKFDPAKHYETDIFLSASAWGRCVCNNITAKAYVQMVHADYSNKLKGWEFEYKKHPKTTHHICVSEAAKKGFEKETGFRADAVLYNFIDNTVPIYDKKKNNVLKIVTLSRLSPEKGIERCVELAKQITFPYTWEIWGEGKIKPDTEGTNIKFMGVTTDPYKTIAKADYLAQLSDSEGYSLSVAEALYQKTPCLVTPFASVKEQIIDNENGYIVPFDIPQFDIQKLVNIPKLEPFIEKTTEGDWVAFFDKILSEIKYCTIEIIAKVKNFQIGDIVEVSQQRADLAVQNKLAKYVNP